jgi:hypothetical protein
MSLISRLSGVVGEGQSYETLKKIGFNQLIAALSESQRGKISTSDIVAQFELAPDEVTEVQALYGKLAALSSNAQREAFLNELQKILYLAEMKFDGSASGGVNYGNLASLETRYSEL